MPHGLREVREATGRGVQGALSRRRCEAPPRPRRAEPRGTCATWPRCPRPAPHRGCRPGGRRYRSAPPPGRRRPRNRGWRPSRPIWPPGNVTTARPGTVDRAVVGHDDKVDSLVQKAGDAGEQALFGVVIDDNARDVTAHSRAVMSIAGSLVTSPRGDISPYVPTARGSRPAGGRRAGVGRHCRGRSWPGGGRAGGGTRSTVFIASTWSGTGPPPPGRPGQTRTTW